MTQDEIYIFVPNTIYIYTHPRLFIVAVFEMAKHWKLFKCSSVGDWLNKLWNIHTMEYLTVIFKRERQNKGNYCELLRTIAENVF